MGRRPPGFFWQIFAIGELVSNLQAFMRDPRIISTHHLGFLMGEW
jgi:hypothetical protein